MRRSAFGVRRSALGERRRQRLSVFSPRLITNPGVILAAVTPNAERRTPNRVFILATVTPNAERRTPNSVFNLMPPPNDD